MVIGDVWDQVPFQSNMIQSAAFSFHLSSLSLSLSLSLLTTTTTTTIIIISLELYSDLKPEGASILSVLYHYYFISEGKRGARFIPSHAAKRACMEPFLASAAG